MARLRGVKLIAAGALAGMLAGAPVFAQAPPPPFPPGPLPPEVAEVAHCLCLKAASQKFGADMTARQRALEDVRARLAEASSELEAERARVDVNNPAAVSHFRQLLERRDDLFRRSSGEMVNETRAVVDRYNASVSEYNARCANRPMDPVLISRIQPTLSCPPL